MLRNIESGVGRGGCIRDEDEDVEEVDEGEDEDEEVDEDEDKHEDEEVDEDDEDVAKRLQTFVSPLCLPVLRQCPVSTAQERMRA